MRIPTRLWNRDFFLLWQGQLVSQIGSKAFVVGMMLWVQEATGSAFLVGTLMTLATLPQVLIGPLAGALADRYSRRAIIVAADGVSGVCSLSVALLFAFSPDATSMLLAVLCFVVVLNSAARSFFRPSVTAAIPDLVPHHKIMAANSLRQSASRISAVLGQGGGGAIYSLLGAPLLFFADGLSYLFSALSECFIRIPPHRHPKPAIDGSAFRRVWNDSIEGLNYVWQYAGMRNLLLIEGLANFFVMPMVVLLPFYVSENLHQGPAWYGWILAGMSGGGIIGFTLAGTFELSGRRRAWVMLGACTGGQLLLGLLAFVDTPILALLDMIMVGILVGMFNVQALTTFQTAASGEFRGRVMGLLGTISMGAAPIGMFLGGVIGDLTGKNVSLIFLGAGAMGVVCTALLGCRGSVLSFLETAPQDLDQAWDRAVVSSTSPLQKGLGGDL